MPTATSASYHISPDGKPRECARGRNPSAVCKYGADTPHMNQEQFENFKSGTMASTDDVFLRVAAETKTGVEENPFLPTSGKRKTQTAVKKSSLPSALKSSSFYGVDHDIEYADWPVPQASDLDKVGLVVDSISNSANSAESIGEAIDVGSRNGSYYANAAGYLGLAEKGKDYDTGATRYNLTSAGETFSHLSADERAVMLGDLVNRSPLVQTYRETGDEKEVKKEIEAGGEARYSDTVADRRLSTIKTWTQTVDSNEGLRDKLSSAQKDTIGRSIIAAQRQRHAELIAKANKPRDIVREICNDCFMEKSASGACGC